MKLFLSPRHSVILFVFTALPLCMSAQNVGIGTNTPEERLHIMNGNLLLSPNTGGIGLLYFNPTVRLQARRPTSNASETSAYGLDFQLNSDLIGGIKSVHTPLAGNYLRFSRSTPTAADLTINSNGNVGVGIATPLTKLHLHNGHFRINHTDANGEIQFQRGGENRGFIQLTGNDGEHLRMGTYSGGTGNFVVRTNGGDRLTVNSSGYVFIPARLALGGALATHPLNVSGNSSFNGDNELIHLNGSGTSRFIQFYRSNVAKAYIQLTGDHLAIGNSTGNNAGNLRLHGNQISIGTNTTVDGYKVSVGGRMICTELRVELTANWPDYVFDDDYTLAPLEKVEHHIQQHKHLPNIPSSSEISESGLHLGEMQRLQMEKIEELFLHVIALKKEIETLKTENEALRMK